MIRGIILGYALEPKKDVNLKEGDLVQRLDGYDNNYYTVKKIERKNQNPYFLESKHNSEQINFHRKELIKCHYAFFDYESYFLEGKLVRLGAVMMEDLNYVRAKKANELEIGWSQLHTIPADELLGLDFYGETIRKELLEDSDPNMPVATVLKYFKIDRK